MSGPPRAHGGWLAGWPVGWPAGRVMVAFSFDGQQEALADRAQTIQDSLAPAKRKRLGALFLNYFV